MEVEKRVVGGCWQLRFDLFLKWDKLLCLYFPWQVEREKNFWAAEHAVFSTNFLTQKLFHEKWLFYWKFHLHFSKSSVHFKDDCAEFSNSCNKHLTWLLNSLLLFTLEWVKVLFWDHIEPRYPEKHWNTEKNAVVWDPCFLIRHTPGITKIPIWKYFMCILARNFDISDLCTEKWHEFDRKRGIFRI